MSITKDFIDVTAPNAKLKALKELRDLEREFAKKGKPFDRYGAMMAFEDGVKQWENEVQRALSRGQEPPAFVSSVNWRSFGDDKLFTLVDEREDTYTNMKTGVIVPKTERYKVYRAKSGGTYTVKVVDSQNDKSVEGTDKKTA